MNTNECRESINQELTLKDIERHLKCQDMKVEVGVYGSYGAFGAGIIFVGISLLLGSGFKPSNDLFASSIFIIIVGFVVMFLSWRKQRNVKRKAKEEALASAKASS